MKKDRYDNLGFALRVAAMSVELDNVKITPVSYDIGVRQTIKTLKIGDWQKRLLEKSSKILNKDIRNTLDKSDSKKVTFNVYVLGGLFYRKGLYICTDLKYELIDNKI